MESIPRGYGISVMERLTDKNWRNLDPWECCGQDKYCKRRCHEQGGCTNGCIVPKLYTRLAKFEDMAEQKPKTNADRIQAMTDEELADFLILSPEMEFYVCCLRRYGNPTPTDDRGQCLALYDCDSNGRAEAFKKWLQQPCEDSTTVEKG